MKIDRRRCSRHRTAALEAHVAALPLALIAAETDRQALMDALAILKHGWPGLCRPPRGDRADAPHTPRIMALHNRVQQIDRLMIGHIRPPED